MVISPWGKTERCYMDGVYYQDYMQPPLSDDQTRSKEIQGITFGGGLTAEVAAKLC